MRTGTKVRLAACLLFFAAIACIYYIRVSNAILEIGDAEAEAMLTTSIYSALDRAAGTEQFKYDDFFTMVQDGGEILCFLTNGVAVNMFTGKIATEVTGCLTAGATRGVDVPSGVFTGIRLLAGFGGNVNIKLIKISSARCELVSEFTEAGINQVKHSLYARVVPDVTLKAIGRSKKFTSSVSVLIFENVIVGKVPDSYLNATIVH